MNMESSKQLKQLVRVFKSAVEAGNWTRVKKLLLANKDLPELVETFGDGGI